MITIQNVQDCIDTLEAIDPNDPSALESAQSAFQKMGKILYLALDLPPKLVVFHSRTNNDDKLYEVYGDIECPKPEHVKHFGRCNFPFKPVFYCSEDRSTSYAELLQYWVEQKKDEFLYVTISKWQIESQLRVLIVPNPDKESRTSEFDKNHGAAFDRQLEQMDNGESRDALIMFFKYIYEKMRKPAKDDLKTYIITSSYCDYALSSSKHIDAILYPSVPFEGKGHNIAIRYDFDFTGNMTLVGVYRDKFERIDLDSIPKFKQIELLEASNLDHEHGTITW